MADKKFDFSFSNIRPVPVFEEDELELVSDGSDFITDDDETEEYMSQENLELYRYLCQKDD